MGFPLSTHCCSDFTPCVGPLQGEVCTAPLPTHWQLPHPVFARPCDAQLRRTPSNCIGVFFRCSWLPKRGVRLSLVFALNHDGSSSFYWPSPLLVLLAFLCGDLIGSTPNGSHAYPPAYSSQGIALSWSFQFKTESPRRHLLCMWVTGT